MKSRLLFLSLFFSFFFSASHSFGQYYYNDIMKTKEVNDEYFTLKKENLSSIKIKSFEEDDSPSEGFYCEKKFNPSFSQSEMISESLFTDESMLRTRYNVHGIQSATTITLGVTNVVNYEYDSAGRLHKIQMISQSNFDSSQVTEMREYFYDKDGRPEKMIRSKSGVNVATIHFEKDEAGNIIKEKASGNSGDLDYFYYYDDKNRLTDIVHFNPYVKKLLPDFMFEYNTKNQVKKMVSVDKNGTDYLTWRYAYTDQNLPEIQKCYSKQKKLLGTIEIEYK